MVERDYADSEEQYPGSHMLAAGEDQDGKEAGKGSDVDSDRYGAQTERWMGEHDDNAREADPCQ